MVDRDGHPVVFIEIAKIIDRRRDGMADEHRIALTELLRKAQMEEDTDFLREGVRVLGQALMELEVSQQLGAERYERTQRVSGAALGHSGRDHRAEGAQGEGGELLPEPIGPKEAS